MTIQGEIKNLEKAQARLVRFCEYLDKQSRYDGSASYDDLYIKVSSVVGSIEDCLNSI